jgi:hypothetical protein
MRKLVVFAAYINVGSFSAAKANEHLHSMSVILNKQFEDVEENVKWIVIPVQNQDTKIECIYPALGNENKARLDKLMKYASLDRDDYDDGSDAIEDFLSDDELESGEGEDEDSFKTWKPSNATKPGHIILQ